MNILSIGNFGTGWDGSICDEEHIASALEELGHSVARVQRETAYEDIGNNWGNPLFDFVLIAQWDNYDERLWSMLPHPRVYWAFDYQADGQEWHERLVKEADLYLSKRIADSKYSNWQWLSQDFAPWFMGRFNEKPERDIDVLFTGSYLPWATERNEVLRAVDEKFNLHIHGVTPDQWLEQGFKHVYGPIMDKDYTALVARAKVNLSIDHTIEAGYWSDRNAQIMACGGMVLTRYVPLMESRFQDKVAYFYNTDDCIKKLEEYLGSWSKRSYLGALGYEFAQKNLMVKNRVKDLLTIVESIL